MFFIFAIILNILILEVVSQDCRISRNNGEGKCISIHFCPQVQYELQYHRIHPDICHFNAFEPIICCPINSSQVPTAKPQPSKERISVIKCKEFYDQNLKEKPQKKPINEDEIVFYPAAVGGKLTEIGEFPFMAAIGWKRYDNSFEFRCGGFLVEKNYVITAAHCRNLGGDAPVVIRTGGNPLNDQNSIDIPIEKIIIHPKYRDDQTYNDIAIIKLKSNSTHVPACLWQFKRITGYEKGTALGYGHVQFAGQGSNDLIQVELKFYENHQCTKYYPPQSEYPSGLIRSQLCAGDPDGIMDTCQGDSGGPILIKNEVQRPYIIGVTSFGSGCAGQSPSIYTRISSHLDWIESIVWK